MNISDKKKDFFISELLDWSKENNRNYFIWRTKKDPYIVMVSEIMLQKTTTKQVETIINDFLEKYPSLEAIQKTEEEEIETILKPLGLYKLRSRRLKKIANIIITEYNGEIPSEKKKLMKLPGIGNYIANSILYIAFNDPKPIVDTNIVRILDRFFSYGSDKKRPRTDNKLWNFVSEITPNGKTKEINFALLDFGALICTAKNPKHKKCPLRQKCDYYIKELDR
ncbi:MAG: hypothetical protein ACTSW1_02025 [Candidatus Hodarchaeales archaeon]